MFNTCNMHLKLGFSILSFDHTCTCPVQKNVQLKLLTCDESDIDVSCVL